MVHCKPAGNGESILKYFAPYIFRVAISNRRLVKLENDNVTFRYKHPKTKKWCRMTLHVFEFMRRFLQHVLPRGFKKVRHYGFMSAKHKQTLARLKLVLGEVESEPTESTTQPDKTIWRPVCPVCGHQMRFVMRLMPYRARDAPDEIVKEPVLS